MARSDENYLELGPLKGQNSTGNPLALDLGWASRTLNVELLPEMSVANKRLGSSVVDTPNGTYMLHRHLPTGTANESTAELWAFAMAPSLSIHRKIGAGAFASVTVPAGLTRVTRAVSFNGKIFFAGTTTSNRMYLWDGTSIRAAGIGLIGAPTTSNTGGGTYPSVFRNYRLDARVVDGNGATQARSELGTGASAMPSGLGAAMRVTRPALPAGATHWVVWASQPYVGLDVYFQLSGLIPAATTFYDDSTLVEDYPDGAPAPLVGTYFPLPAATRVITDGRRLILSGNGSGTVATAAGELAPRDNRVWYTPVLGSLDQGDDERIPDTLEQRNYLDIGENTTIGSITDMGGPMDGQIYVFQKRRTWRLVPTGDLITPYLTYPVSDRYGADAALTGSNVAVVSGENDTGQPALYFRAVSGLYRVSNTNVEYVSYDIASNFDASNNLAPWLLSFPERKQLWLVTQTASGSPRIFVFQWDQGRADEDGDIRGGWTTWEHAEATGPFTAGCLHNAVPGTATPAAESLIPYLAHPTTDAYRFDRTTAQDGATAYAAWVEFAPVLATAARRQFRSGEPQMVCSAGVGQSLTATAIRDFGVEERSSTVSIAPLSTEAHVIRAFDGLFQGDITALQIRIGDAAPTPHVFRVQFLTVPTYPQEPR